MRDEKILKICKFHVDIQVKNLKLFHVSDLR